MKKFLGIFFLSAIAFAAVPFCAHFAEGEPGRVRAAETWVSFEDFNNTFQDTDAGIFILKDTSAVYSADDYYIGSVSIAPISGNLYYEPGLMYEYSAVREVDKETGKEWEATDLLFLLNPEPETGLTLNESADKPVYLSSKKTISYKLYKNVPAGKYGIRVTPYKKLPGQEKYTFVGTIGSYEYPIVYGTELNHLYISSYRMYVAGTLTAPVTSSSYRVRDRGNGLGRELSLKLSVNPGAVYANDTDTNIEGTPAGDLTVRNYISIEQSNIAMSVEDSQGRELDWEVISTISQENSVQDGRIKITLPSSLAAGTYVVRVWHVSNQGVSAAFIIDNGGGAAPAMGMGILGDVFLIFGVLVILSAAVLLVWPRVEIFIHESAAEREEKARLKKAGIAEKKAKEEASKNAYEAVKAITKELEERKNLSELEREELIKKRDEEYNKTKTGGFLRKLNDNRMKREFARDSGMSMEEFRELELKQQALEDAKKSGLSGFRNEAEIGGEGGAALGAARAITQQQVDEAEAAAREKEARHTSKAGEPVFDLLDSVKEETSGSGIGGDKSDLGEAAAAQKTAEQEAEKQSGARLLDRLKKLTGEE